MVGVAMQRSMCVPESVVVCATRARTAAGLLNQCSSSDGGGRTVDANGPSARHHSRRSMEQCHSRGQSTASDDKRHAWTHCLSLCTDDWFTQPHRPAPRSLRSAMQISCMQKLVGLIAYGLSIACLLFICVWMSRFRGGVVWSSDTEAGGEWTAA